VIRHGVRTLAVLALLWIPVHASAQTADLPNLTERMFIASQLYTAIQVHFAHWEDIPNVDVDSAYRAYLTDAIAAESRLEWTLANMRFLGTLRNGHSWFVDYGLRGTLGRGLGFYLRYLDGSWVVSQSHVDGLPVGSVVRTIDGRDFEAFFKEKRAYMTASTDRYARHVITSDRYAGFLFPMRFTLETAAGSRVVIDRTGAYQPTGEGKTEGRWLEDDRIGYVRIPSFADPGFQRKALEYVTQFHSAGGLVIDVRGNHGGSTPGRLIEALMDRLYRWYQEATPYRLGTMTSSSSRYRLEWTPNWERPDSAAFRGRVVILIDGGCASACEDFIVPFKDNHRAVLVGEASAGSSGQPYITNFLGSISVGIGAKREIFPDGSTFEGVGAAPDVPVLPTPADYRAGRDPVLTRAMEILNRS
jgi:carboxyl-terminal processing protease